MLNNIQVVLPEDSENWLHASQLPPCDQKIKSLLLGVPRKGAKTARGSRNRSASPARSMPTRDKFDCACFNDYFAPRGVHMTIDFKNLVLGTHESKVLFMWNPENLVLGAFLGIKDGIETILAKDGTTAAQRANLEELRAAADKSDWDFAALRKSLVRPARES